MESQQQPSSRDLITIILLGLAALLTAWSSFQSALWDGDALDSYSISDLQLSQASALRDSALSLYVAEQALFIEYAKASRSGDTGLAAYIRDELMSQRLREALRSWEAASGESREGSPLSETYGYVVPGRAEGDRLSQDSVERVGEARDADKAGDKYNLATVLFAGSLFLVGLSSTSRFRRVDLALLAMGGAMLLVTGGWLITLSVANPF